jgi:hypothetical protein
METVNSLRNIVSITQELAASVALVKRKLRKPPESWHWRLPTNPGRDSARISRRTGCRIFSAPSARPAAPGPSSQGERGQGSRNLAASRSCRWPHEPCYRAQQDVRSYHVSGSRTPATTCRIASITKLRLILLDVVAAVFGDEEARVRDERRQILIRRT